MIISVEVDAPTPQEARSPWYVGGIVVAVVFVVMLLWSLDPGPPPDPAPVPDELAGPLTEDQQTYLLYSSWLQSEAFAECMRARGFSREAVAGGQHSRVNAVAAHLAVEPRAPTTWLAPAEARSGRPRSGASSAEDLYAALKDADAGGCQSPRDPIDVGNPSAVATAVAAARADADFTGYLAESSWLADNPADALLYQTHLLMTSADGGIPAPSSRWDGPLAQVRELIDGVPGWSSGPSEAFADFAQVVAVSGDGSMVVVRVGDPAVIEHGFVSRLGTPMVDCGGVGVAVGMAVEKGAAADAGSPYAALMGHGCEALAKG